MSDVDRIKQRIEKEQKFDEDLWNTEANQASQIDKAIHDARKFLYRTIFSIIDEELAKEPQECKWFKYDYRTIAPKNHDVENPYWRIPENMDKLKYCPYCGRKIKVIE